MTHTPITPDHPITEAGRLMMAEELDTVRQHLPALRDSQDGLAVHETRKAIRRSFTLFKLFTPYFAPGELEPHRRALRRLMRRLAPCRDLAVFRQKLADYNATAGEPLIELAYWAEERQDKDDYRLGRYLDRKKGRKALRRYEEFVTTESEDATAASVRVRHVLPALVFQRIGAVRAWGDLLPDAPPAQFHQLRIQFKELRYTLAYFEDILGETSGSVIELTRLMQEHLGHLNDARVAVELLDEMADQCPDEAAVYAGHQQAVLANLTAEFCPLYELFDRPVVRQVLADTLAGL